MMRVVLTGADGFTGRYVLQALRAQGARVLCIQKPHAESRLAPDIIHADLCDHDADLESAFVSFAPTHVIHLAALSHVTLSSSLEYYRVNVLGTERLLFALTRVADGLKKVVIASSANVYGNSPHSPIAEVTAPAPVNHYASSKLAMEHVARTFDDRLPLIISRPFNYTGRGQAESFIVPKLVGHFARRQSAIKLGNIEVARDFSDVRFIAEAYVRLLGISQCGVTVNLCSGQATSLEAVIEMLHGLTGHSISVERSADLVRASDIRVLCGDNSLLHRLIGDIARPSLRETIQWMLEVA
jgi:GDP-6-deoxy-D-talose 4-dehydrogenase